MCRAAASAAPPGVGPDDTVLLIGVTGVTGRCALDGLLAGGLAPRQLLAVSRNPDGAAARAVAARGAAVAAADLDDPASLAPLLDRARFVYVHALSGDAASADPLELARGRALAALLAARQAKAPPLGLVAYNSSAGRGSNAGISQMDQKHRVADILLDAGAPFLGLEAAMFYEEWWKKYTRPSIVGKNTFPFSLPADRPLQMVAARDVGYIAARAMREPGKWAGQQLPVAGDELTPVQMCAAFAEAQGVPEVKHSNPPAWLFWLLSRDLWRIIQFLRTTGYRADVAATRAAFPGVLSFREFLATTGWRDAARTYEAGIEYAAGGAASAQPEAAPAKAAAEK